MKFSMLSLAFVGTAANHGQCCTCIGARRQPAGGCALLCDSQSSACQNCVKKTEHARGCEDRCSCGSPTPSPTTTGSYCTSDMNHLESAARSDSQGRSPDGKCYTHVSAYIEKVGYGGICTGCFDSKIPSQYWAEAHMFADFLNKGSNAANLKMKNIKSSVSNNPYNAPAGSIVVVRAGTPGTANPTAGDIAVKGSGSSFWNGGSMGYGGSGNFPASNTYVLGIYVPTSCHTSLGSNFTWEDDMLV